MDVCALDMNGNDVEYSGMNQEQVGAKDGIVEQRKRQGLSWTGFEIQGILN